LWFDVKISAKQSSMIGSDIGYLLAYIPVIFQLLKLKLILK